MIKYSLLAVSVFSLLAACSANQDESGIENTTLEEGTDFLIQGTISGLSNDSVYLEALQDKSTISIAQTVLNEDGEFSMDGKLEGLGVYQLRVSQFSDKGIYLTLKPGDKLELTTSSEKFGKEDKISGVEWGDAYSEYMDIMNEYAAGQKELGKQRKELSDEEIQSKFLKLKAPLGEFVQDYVGENPSSALNLLLFNGLFPAGGYGDYPEENIEIIGKMKTAYEKEFPDAPITEKIAKAHTQIAAGFKEYQLLKSGEKAAPEIALNSPDGNEIALSSLKGKIVLIDFWASWCGPCRRENPNVVKLYNEYKDKGFTVYSVSLDKSADKWKAAIEQDGLVWPNHVSDLQGWETPLTRIYAFNSIPHTVLVGKNGNIIDIGLRGKSLEQKLKELFG